MKLYFLPMSCSFAAHVACLEANIPFELCRVRRRNKRLEDGTDYLTIAPMGNVPAVTLEDGSSLTESAAVLQYIADQAPQSQLAPPAGSPERYRLAEWLNFISTELHKQSAWIIFNSKTDERMKTWSRANAAPALQIVDTRLQGREFALGQNFTVADAYLFWVLYIFPHIGVPLETFPAARDYVARHAKRPSILKALQYEGALFFKDKAEDAPKPQSSAEA